MAGTYTDLTTVDAADALTNWSVTNGTLTLRNDINLEGTNCLVVTGGSTGSYKVITLDMGAGGIDLSTDFIWFWLALSDIRSAARMNNKDDGTNPGLEIQLEDTSGNWKRWQVTGQDTYTTARLSTSWARYVIDVDSTADSTSGTLTNTAVRYLRIRVYQNTGSVVTCVDYVCRGRGLTLTGGGTVGTPLTLDDLVDHDVTNSLGIIEKRGSFHTIKGDIVIDSTASDTHLADELKSLFWYDDRSADAIEEVCYASGNEPKFIVQETGANDTNVTFGDATSEVGGLAFSRVDTAPIIDFDDAVTTNRWYGCQFIQFDWSTASAGNADMQNCVLQGCEELALDGRTFEGNTISEATSGVLMKATHVSKDNTYIGCTDAIHVSDNGPLTVTLDGDMFSGNTDDIHFSGTGALTVKNTNGADASTSRVSGGGTVTIENIVTVSVTAEEEDGDPIQNARVLLKKVSDSSTVLEGLTNASGVLEDTDYDFPGASFAVEGWVRKHDSSPYYKEGILAGSVTSTGYVVTVVMVSDE